MSGSWTARAAALDAVRSTRGTRFLARRQGERVADVTDLFRVPAWLGWEATKQRRLSLAAALLHHRPALDRELRGEVLVPVAAATGERLFDAICRADFRSRSRVPNVPALSQLAAEGEALLDAARQRGDYEASLANTAAALVEAEAA